MVAVNHMLFLTCRNLQQQKKKNDVPTSVVYLSFIVILNDLPPQHLKWSENNEKFRVQSPIAVHLKICWFKRG